LIFDSAPARLTTDGGFCRIVLVAERCGMDLGLGRSGGGRQAVEGDKDRGRGGRWSLVSRAAEPSHGEKRTEGRRACFARWTLCKMVVPKVGPFCHGAGHLLLIRTSSALALAISFSKKRERV
jgi:hypothetical protein